ncbi:Hypothetical predicted protein [Mytilus galloprovincialis]|uniref:C-type lectin domain-containing protein n=1 Tax=Mytilus galloprovincialis TaxID=29158 RepID=A0A8B6FA56_MYTGA|nr:Hypothetical predicted protein [Mytilus galloprovincialis]
MSVIQTSVGVKYHSNITASIDIKTWKIGTLDKTSLISCIMMCMQADNCFWATFNSDACDLLSITKKEMVDFHLIIRNGGLGLQIYQMIKGCSKQACRLLDGCVFVKDDSYCVKYYVDGLEYQPARTFCRQNGGELFRIDSSSKQTRLGTILTQYPQISQGFTIQGRKDNAGNWLFDDGTRMPYFNWNTDDDQPNNSTIERYIYINSMYNWKWHDIGPDVRPFLCEIHV